MTGTRTGRHEQSQIAEATVDLTALEGLPGAADKNFEALTRAIVSRRYGRLGKLRERRNQPGVEFYLQLEHAGPLGDPGRLAAPDWSPRRPPPRRLRGRMDRA